LKRRSFVIGLLVLIAILGGAALLHKIQGWMFDEAMLTADVQPVSDRQRAAAEDWFGRNGYDIVALKAEPVAERAKRLGFLTHLFCTPGAGNPANLNTLYRKCVTACGGYAYVYRGLAAVAGLQSRFVDFYTMPFQADHTAVEVKQSDGSWGFVDPTMGVIFTDNGKPDGKLLSLAQVSSLPAGDLTRHVVQAREDRKISYIAPLGVQYGGNYSHAQMPIDNYDNSETVSHDMPNEMVVLRIPMSAAGSGAHIGNFEAQDGASLDKGWMQFAMDTIADKDLDRRVSPDASDLYNDREDRLTVLALSGLEPGKVYRLELRAANMQSAAARVQFGTIGRGVILMGDTIADVVPQLSTVRLDFRARRNTAEIYMHNLARKGMVRMLAIRVSAKPPAATVSR
jgi:hypothetical protein